jgi:hypothetical protein
MAEGIVYQGRHHNREVRGVILLEFQQQHHDICYDLGRLAWLGGPKYGVLLLMDCLI